MIHLSDAYELLYTTPVEEIGATAYGLHHKKSGAKLLLLESADDNKVFSITFKTTPENSTGVPHIMEHSVLCGSDKYPLKDPFVELCKGSLNTFLNAMTWPDKTSYPVASRNEADFRNLMSVYMDAVLHPNIYRTEKILKQEGWHYELESPEAELKLNGVVYNEMRGAFSSVDTILENTVTENLYPGTTYEVCSGGDPEFIPDLTYDEFIVFHKRYYHPSNSFIFLYGDMDFEERLAWLDEAYLSQYDAIDPKTEVKTAAHFAARKDVRTAYNVAAGEEEKNSVFVFATGMDNLFDPVEVKAMEVLSYALMNAPGAPLKKALLKDGFAADVYGGYDSGYRQPNFSVIAKGVDPADYDAFKATVDRVLRDVVREGIPKKTLLAGIHNIEFSLREADYGRMPKGLIYNFVVADTWLHDETKALINLKYNETFDRLKELVPTDYFEKLTVEKILDNPFGITVLVEAKAGLTAKKDALLAEKLAAYKASLSPEEIDRLVRETAELKAYQEEEETKENLESIPLLKLSDVDPKAKPLVNEEREIAGVKTLYHDLQTNGIGYLEARFSLETLTEEELLYAGLLRELYTGVDTELFSYQELGDEISFKTGGIGTATNVATKAPDYEEVLMSLGITARYLVPETEDAIALVREIFGHSRFDDTDRIREILEGVVSAGQDNLVNAGHSTAVKRLFAKEDKGAYLDDLLNNLGFFRFASDLKARFDAEKDTLPARLAAVEKKILSRDHLLLSFTGSEEGYKALEKALKPWIEALPVLAEPAAEIPFTPHPENEAISTSSMVQYTAMGGNFRKYGLEYTGAFRVFSILMRYQYLWQNIRVKGGAYGCGTRILRSGRFGVYSYRDPHLKNTIDVFAGIPDYLENLELDDRTMLQYILGTMGDEDMPMQPSQEGQTAFMAWIAGVTDADIQKTRDEILGCTVADLRALAPFLRKVLAENSYVTIGSETKIEENRDLYEITTTLSGEAK